MIFGGIRQLLNTDDKGDTMTGITPTGAKVRKAVKWVSDQRKYEGSEPLVTLIEEASKKFDLSPKDADFLFRFLSSEQQD